MAEINIKLTERQARIVLLEIERIAESSDDAGYRRVAADICRRIRNATSRPTLRGTDVLSCGHDQGIVFGESSWTCAVCGQPARGSR